MKYNQYPNLDLPALDREMLARWQAEGIFERSMKERQGREKFVFYEGPPSANGMPGIHHVLARSVKDVFCRFQTMKGKEVLRKAGWDTHGLPIELAVEKRLGITKEDIGTKISIADYNAECKKTVMAFKSEWDRLTTEMGYWVDLNDPYITYDNRYISSVWSLLKRLYNKDLLYKGDTIQPYSPAAGTGLSSHELNQPGCYREVKDTTVVAMFKLKANAASAWLFAQPEEDVRVMAWTTTPWTLPSNIALGVGPKIDYVKVQTFNPYTEAPVSVILAKALLSRWFKPEGEQAEMVYDKSLKVLPYRVLAEFSGQQLEGLAYEQLLPYVQPEGRAFEILLGDFVSTEDGTGIVHLAPSFGADDRLVCEKYGMANLTLVNKKGQFVAEAGPLAGRYVKNYTDEAEYKEVDVDIAVDLKSRGYAFRVEKYAHNYPHCWRTDKPILYYPLDSWFVKTSSLKERMAQLNREQINWKPKATGEGRFGGWLDNLRDWNLSRSRFWGIPLPIWRNADASVERCIGGMDELIKQGFLHKDLVEPYFGPATKTLPLGKILPVSSTGDYISLEVIKLERDEADFEAKFDLHKPLADEIVLIEQGQILRREADLIDVWFDSGAMPYAQWGYTADEVAQGLAEGREMGVPADFIAEGVDQTRGWFYTLHAIAVLCFDTVAYRNVVSNGLVLDKNGQKMSKRLGNAVDPFQTLQTYGADATRWYMLTNAQPWDDLRFDLEGLDQVRRQFFGTLFNTYNFFALYANVDHFEYGQALPLAERAEIDRWILSRLHRLIQEVEADYSQYEPTQAGRKIQTFVDIHLSNWFVRLSRRRFWKNDQGHDKQAAYQTLFECLFTVAKLMAPIAPFFADRLYTDLNKASGLEPHDSVHLAFFPEAKLEYMDEALEQRMDYAQRLASSVLSLRKRENIRVRQPLQKILVPDLGGNFAEQIRLVENLILAEVNVKELLLVTDADGMVKKKAKPNLKTLGKRFGAKLNALKTWIEGLEQAQIHALERSGQIAFELEGESHTLVLEDFLISSEDIEGWVVARDGDLVVALDVNITPELESEGLARELVNRVQNLRKDQGLEVSDRIALSVQAPEAVQAAFQTHADYIAHEVLAKELNWHLQSAKAAKEIELLDDLKVTLDLYKLA